jgi:UDP-glucuronate 4-epimerase
MVDASSSSVDGANQALPFAERDRVDTPLSLYAATKRADELMSHAYAHLYGIPQTGLRFFTVYGPWGRPDMAYFSFAEAIMAGRPITLYDDGSLRRDFTYVDDIVAGILGCFDRPPEGAPPHRVMNIGNNRSEAVSTLVDLLERSLGREAIRHYAPRPAADVTETCADVDAIGALAGFAPSTPLDVGIPRFSAWFTAWRKNSSGDCHKGG